MAILRDDTYLRGRVSRRRVAVSGLHCALIFVAATVLTLSRLDHPLAKELRGYLHAGASAPLETADEMAAPLRSFWRRALWLSEGSAEVERLRAENIQLKTWKRRAAELERRLHEQIPDEEKRELLRSLYSFTSDPSTGQNPTT